MACRNVCDNIAPLKRLFFSVYTVVIIAVVVSLFYVFSDIYSSKPTVDSFGWLSYPSSLPSVLHKTINFSESVEGNAVPTPALGPQGAWVKPVLELPPRNKKMPPLEAFRLTKELVQQRAKDNIVIVTFGNYAYMDFTLTCWCNGLRIVAGIILERFG